LLGGIRSRRSVDWRAFRQGRGDHGRSALQTAALNAAAAVGAFIVLVVVLRLVLPKPVPLGLLLFGTVIGSINALIAVGLILIYRANRIINFALAEIGVFGGILFENLVRASNVP
jgi:hypothetical protein